MDNPDYGTLPYLYLTTTGWKSGRPHEIEIWFVEHEGNFYLVAEKRARSHWVQNIQRNAAVRIRVADRHEDGRGRTVDPAAEPDLARVVRQKMDAKYQWSDGLIVELASDQHTAS
jgi:deazaflavin-dependent oxidoreductase (nitroreductase family)